MIHPLKIYQVSFLHIRTILQPIHRQMTFFLTGLFTPLLSKTQPHNGVDAITSSEC